MNLARIATLYACIAAAASCVNLISQWLVMRLLESRDLVILSVAAGVLAGLPVKYELEKRYIFAFRVAGLAHDGQVFLVYSVLGVAPTLVFLGFEWTFHLLFGSDTMRYLGALIGLTVGSVLKFNLDKRYVFKHPSREMEAPEC